MTFSHWQRPHAFSVPDVTTDVLIVGGGFVGLSTAFWISEINPALRITVLERRLCGEGASGRNAGFLTKGSASFFKSLWNEWGDEKAKEILAFAETSLQLVNQHILKPSPELKTEKTSSLTLLSENKDDWSKNFPLSEYGFNWKELTELGFIKGDSYTGGLEQTSPEFKVNPFQLLSSLRKNLEARKIQIIENVSGFQLTPEGCVTELHTIRCKQVVLALNGYSSQFSYVLNDFITPKKAQMLAVEIEGSLEAPHLYYDPKHLVYWRKATENVVLIGGKRTLDIEGEVGEYDRLSTIIQPELENYLRETLRLRYKVLHRWAGTMGFTQNELPYVQKISAPLDTYLIAGFSGHGMGLGFHSAKEMAELVTSQKSSSFFDQFHERQITL